MSNISIVIKFGWPIINLKSSRFRMTAKTIAVDLVFVLDATQSTQNVFSSMVDQVNDLAIDLEINYRKANIQYGAVIYRDPVDYHEIKSVPLDPETRTEHDKLQAQLKKERDLNLRKHDIDPEVLDREIAERESHFDREKFPFNKNVAIDVKNDIDQLISELMKVECGSGNDEPEDWVGALKLALDSIAWRENSKRGIVWISDANAHGKLYCGYSNHDEEEPKMEPLVKRMAEERIHFVGINVVRTYDRGCERTLNIMKELYHKYGGKSFLIEEFVPPKNDYLDDDDNEWPQDVMTQFIQTINKSLKRMGSLFDDFDV